MNRTSEMFMDLVHSNNEPGVPSPMNHINVRFVPFSTLRLQIRHAMKTATNPNHAVVASLFERASRFDYSAPAAGLKNLIPGPEHSHFADLLAEPEKLKEALRAAREENDAFAASRTIREPGAPAKIDVAGKIPASPVREIRKVQFVLEAPDAKSVKLAADFTDWEKCPLDMIPSRTGVWSAVVPLEPGEYPYRFIVDGQWWDDPRSSRRVGNPYGTRNALMVVL